MTESETKEVHGAWGPQLTEQQHTALIELWRLWQVNREVINEHLRDFILHDDELRTFADRPTTEAERSAQTLRERLEELAIMEGQWQPLIEDLGKLGELYAVRGLSFRAWPTLISAFRGVMDKIILSEYRGKQDLILSVMEAKAIFLDTILAALGEGYLRSKEAIIQKQQNQIRELSTPVLQLEDRLLVLPLIGSIDSDRAGQITNQLLEAIRTRHARAAVIDVTGVVGTGEKLANHLVRTVESARLMGAAVIITGLSSETTQDLVKLGVDLRTLNTEGDLQEGVEVARRLLDDPKGVPTRPPHRSRAWKLDPRNRRNGPDPARTL